MWGAFFWSASLAPGCRGEDVVIESVIDNGTFKYAKATTLQGVVQARVAPDIVSGDSLRIYTQDGVNYWDESETLVYEDGNINKSLGILGLGMKNQNDIRNLSYTFTQTGMLAAIIAGLLFVCLLSETPLQRERRKHGYSKEFYGLPEEDPTTLEPSAD